MPYLSIGCKSRSSISQRNTQITIEDLEDMSSVVRFDFRLDQIGYTKTTHNYTHKHENTISRMLFQTITKHVI
jgi:hypothetical protein